MKIKKMLLLTVVLCFFCGMSTIASEPKESLILEKHNFITGETIKEKVEIPESDLLTEDIAPTDQDFLSPFSIIGPNDRVQVNLK